MRALLFVVILSGLATSGCLWKKRGQPRAAKAPAPVVVAQPPPAAFALLPGETPPPPPQPKPTPAPEQKAPSTSVTTPPEQKPPPIPPAAEPKLIVTPENSLIGKVATVNASARFVVLSFPVGHLPPVEQKLNVNRRGLKVGEVKITGPQLDENIVADITAGDVEPGDEVRDR
jgi:hypothetical protein